MSKSATDGLDLYLKGWSGETFTKKRHDKIVTVHDPNIVVGLVVQPEVARLAIGDDMLRSRGFPQRFLYTLAPAITDRSYLDSSNVPAKTSVQWETCIQDIAALPRRQGARAIALNEEALHRYAQLADRLDRERQDMARPLFEREWLAKAHGQALRIAGIFALMRSPDVRTITEAEVAAAEAWVDLSLTHLGLVLKSMACGDRVVQQAQRVLRWLEQGSREQASRNEITQALRSAAFDTVEQWKPVFDLLEGNGWLRPVRVKAAGAQGGRPSLVFEINPALMSGVVAA